MASIAGTERRRLLAIAATAGGIFLLLLVVLVARACATEDVPSPTKTAPSGPRRSR